MTYEGEAPSVGALPYYMDSTIKQMADASGIANLVEMVSSEHTSLLEDTAREADIVLVWRAGSGQGNRVPDGPLKPVIMKKKHYFIDHKQERFAGSFYLRLSSEICTNDATIKECREKFEHIPAHNFSKIGYIYGTGPSLASAMDMDLSDGTSIVCNTMVKNKELMHKLKPPVITVADPIFHAGCSSYAYDFRRHLLEAMVEFDSYLIVPMRDYALYIANMDSSLRERIIGIPIVPPNIAPGQMPNLNLYKKFQVTPAASILMLFLIPLAATFFEKTFILGCDGRPLDQDDYFWKHDPASQLVERMDEIQAAHPAFFKIDYHDFYLEHCRVVARWLEEAERQGKRFFSLTSSYIPALKSRYVSIPGVLAEPYRESVKGQVHIISLNPHFTDSFGHFLAYDTKLYSACTQRGVEFISAANSKINSGLTELHPYIRAVFTDISYMSGVVKGNKEPAALQVERFRSEVEGFVDEYLRTCKPGDKVILYLYTGGPRHIEMLYDIIKARPQVSAHINFFFVGSTYICDQAFRERWTETLRKPLLEDRLVVTVPTREMQSEIQEAVQVVLPLAPAPSTTFDDGEARNALEQSDSHLLDNTESATCNVLFPGLMREAKGYDLSISIIRMLREKQADTSYQCTVRYVPRRDTPPELIKFAQEARRYANIVEGILPPEEFQRMLKEADIIVLPYQPSDFSNRTSGLLIDALLCGVPVVVQKDTWLGNLVARYNCGALAETGSPEAYVKAIELVAANHTRYQKNAISAGKEWLADNNWAALLDFILAPPPPFGISQEAITAKPQEETPKVFSEVASGVAMPMKSLTTQARLGATSTDSLAIPTVSIVMPAFNASGSIGESIASIQSQSFTDWELVVVDDRSLDDTREVVVRLAESDPRIHLLQCKGNGVSDARNTGLDAARGDFITFLDADDFMYPDALERRVEALKENPDWNLVHCVTEWVDVNSKKLGWQLGRPKEISFRYMSGNPCHVNSLMGRSQVFKSARFQTGLTNGEDWLFISDILRTGEVSHKVEGCSVAYVVRRDSVVCRDYLSHENKLLETLDMIYSPVRNNLPAAREFAQGLSSPPKEVVALRRRIGLLTWLLLEDRGNDLAAVLSELSDQALSALSRGEIRQQIIYPTMRFYICRQEELSERLHKDKAHILRLISQTGIDKTFPQYADEFKSLMIKASETKLKAMQVSDSIIGPFKRHDHAHIDESAMLAALLIDQTKTGVMIDVGAMHGSSLSRFCHAGWRVFAFEPDPTNRKELETRFGHNPNLTIDDRAVADRIAENLPFYSSAETPSISSLHPFHKSHKETCMVSITTIADFVREKDLHYIDYLKIDAESYDLLVLKGVPWHSIKPNVIMCEFEDRKTRSLGYTMHDMAHYLTERGYKVMVSEWHPIIRYGIRHDWHRLVPYPCELDDPNACGNLIAFRGQQDLQVIAEIARRIVKVDKVAPRGGARLPSLRDRRLYHRLLDYLNIHYPTIITLGRFGVWSLSKLKKTLFGIGGIAILVIAGLYIAGTLIEPARWYLVGIASALLLLGGGLLALSYAKQSVKAINDRLNRDSRDMTQLQADLEEWKKFSESIKVVSDLLENGSKDRSKLNASLEQLKTELPDYVRVIHDRLNDSAIDRAELKATLEQLQKDISDSKDSLAKMNVGNFPLFQQLNRRLTNEDLKRFTGEWAPKLGLNLDARALAYIAHRICLAEDTCVGYLAGNIETMLLRVLVARSVIEPNLEVLEIGTLFGIGVAMIHENCRGLFSNTHFTVIDPLIGLIGRHDKNPLDPLTKAPVTREIFIHNMQRMNIPKSDYTVIEKLSTEDEAIEQASKRRYNLLIIDGDHSYFGVKHDFYNYRHLVKRGGYIIFDDYGNPRWPGLTNFVDKEVAKIPGLEFVGTDVFTAVFRVITRQGPIKMSNHEQ